MPAPRVHRSELVLAPGWPACHDKEGFLDRFTVTLSRQAQRLAVEDGAAFDHHFGVPLAD